MPELTSQPEREAGSRREGIMAPTADRTRRLYPEVSGRERFRLVVEMAVRGQDLEADEIVMSASRVDGSCLDPAMCEAFEELRSLLREFDASTRKLFGCLLVLDAMRHLFNRVAESGCGDEPVYDIPSLLDLVDQLASVVELHLRARETALGGLARERLGLEPATTRLIQPPWVQAAFDAYRERIDRATPDAAEVASARDDLLFGWVPMGSGACTSRERGSSHALQGPRGPATLRPRAQARDPGGLVLGSARRAGRGAAEGRKFAWPYSIPGPRAEGQRLQSARAEIENLFRSSLVYPPNPNYRPRAGVSSLSWLATTWTA
jgi:hypothetical protein